MNMKRIITIIALFIIALSAFGQNTGEVRLRQLERSATPWQVIAAKDSLADIDRPYFPGYIDIRALLDSSNILPIEWTDLETNLAHTAKHGWNGTIIEGAYAYPTSDGVTVTLHVEEGVPDNDTLSVNFSDGYYLWDVSAASVTLTPGEDTLPVSNYVYLVQSTKTLEASTAGFPSAEHAPIAVLSVQSAASVQTDGPYRVHLYTDHAITGTNQGHIYDLNYWIRQQDATYTSGVDQIFSVIAGSPDTISFATGPGTVLQLHPHTYPAFAYDDPYYIVNYPGENYKKIGSFNEIDVDATGASINNKYFSIVIFGIVNENTGDCKRFILLPSGSYPNSASVLEDVENYANYAWPREFTGVAFLISELKIFYSSGPGVFTIEEHVDLRGLEPSTGAGGGVAGSSGGVISNFEWNDDGGLIGTKMLITEGGVNHWLDFPAPSFLVANVVYDGSPETGGPTADNYGKLEQLLADWNNTTNVWEYQYDTFNIDNLIVDIGGDNFNRIITSLSMGVDAGLSIFPGLTITMDDASTVTMLETSGAWESIVGFQVELPDGNIQFDSWNWDNVTGAYENVRDTIHLTDHFASVGDTSHWSKSGNFLYPKDLANYVGINTATPSGALHVNGVSWFEDDLYYRDGATTRYYKPGNVSYAQMRNQTNYFSISSADNSKGTAVAVDNAGNLGINTTTPGAKLNIQASADTETGFLYETSEGYDVAVIRNESHAGILEVGYVNRTNDYAILDGGRGNTGGSLQLYDNGVREVSIASGTDSYITGGNLGIGTTSPARKLHVVDNVATTSETGGKMLRLDNPNTTFSNTVTTQEFYSGLVNTGYLQGQKSIGFHLGYSGRDMTIDPDGNVGISITTPDKKLHIYELIDTTHLILQDGGGLGAKVGLDLVTSSGLDRGSRIESERISAGNFNSELRFYTDGGVNGRTIKMSLNDVGQLTLPYYTPGAFTGTGTDVLLTDATGQVIQADLGDFALAADTSHWSKSGNFLYPKDLANNVGIGKDDPSTKLDIFDANIVYGFSLETGVGRKLQMRGEYINFQRAGASYISASDPAAALYLGAGAELKNTLAIKPNETIVNENLDDHDFRIKGDTKSHLLYVDASLDNIGVNTTAPTSRLYINGDIDTEWPEDSGIRNTKWGGASILSSITTGFSNFAYGGGNLLNGLTTGQENAVFGSYNLNWAEDPDYNLAVGTSNAISASTVNSNAFIGFQNFRTSTGSIAYVTAIGNENCEECPGSVSSAFLGFRNMQDAATGSIDHSLFAGQGNGELALDADYSLVVGYYNASVNNVDINYSTLIGLENADSSTVITASTMVGDKNYFNSSQILYSTGLGVQNGYSAETTSSYNTLAGLSNFQNASDLDYSTGFGYNNVQAATGAISYVTVSGGQNYGNALTVNYSTGLGYRNFYLGAADIDYVAAFGNQNFLNATDADYVLVNGVTNGWTATSSQGSLLNGISNGYFASVINYSLLNGSVNAEDPSSISNSLLVGQENLKDVPGDITYVTAVGRANAQNASDVDYSTLLGYRNVYTNAADIDYTIINGSNNAYVASGLVYATNINGYQNLYGTTGNIRYSLVNGQFNLFNNVSGLEYGLINGYQNLYNSDLSNSALANGYRNGYAATASRSAFLNGWLNAESASTVDYSFYSGHENLKNSTSFGNYTTIIGYRNLYTTTGSGNATIAIGQSNGFESIINMDHSIYLGVEQAYSASNFYSDRYKLSIGQARDVHLIAGDFEIGNEHVDIDGYFNVRDSLVLEDYGDGSYYHYYPQALYVLGAGLNHTVTEIDVNDFDMSTTNEIYNPDNMVINGYNDLTDGYNFSEFIKTDSEFIVNASFGDVDDLIYLDSTYIGHDMVGWNFADEGTRLYAHHSSDTIVQYSLSIPYDVKTLAFVAKQYLNFTSGGTSYMSRDGLYFISGDYSATIEKYSLSTAWDITTAVKVEEWSLTGGHDNYVRALFMRDNELDFYTSDNDEIRHYRFSKRLGGDVTLIGTKNIAAQRTDCYGLTFAADGLRMYTTGNSADDIEEYVLSTAWDITTAVYVSQKYTSANGETVQYQINQKEELNRFWVGGTTADLLNIFYYRALDTFYLDNPIQVDTASMYVFSLEVAGNGSDVMSAGVECFDEDDASLGIRYAFDDVAIASSWTRYDTAFNLFANTDYVKIRFEMYDTTKVKNVRLNTYFQGGGGDFVEVDGSVTNEGLMSLTTSFPGTSSEYFTYSSNTAGSAFLTLTEDQTYGEANRPVQLTRVGNAIDFHVPIDNLETLSSVNDASDYLMIRDATDGDVKKVLPSNLQLTESQVDTYVSNNGYQTGPELYDPNTDNQSLGVDEVNYEVTITSGADADIYELVEKIVANIFDNGEHSGITVTPSDVNNEIDLTVTASATNLDATRSGSETLFITSSTGDNATVSLGYGIQVSTTYAGAGEELETDFGEFSIVGSIESDDYVVLYDPTSPGTEERVDVDVLSAYVADGQGMVTWTADADSGTPTTLTNGATLDHAGGEGIVTSVGSATVTTTLDLTELGTQSFNPTEDELVMLDVTAGQKRVSGDALNLTPYGGVYYSGGNFTITTDSYLDFTTARNTYTTVLEGSTSVNGVTIKENGTYMVMFTCNFKRGANQDEVVTFEIHVDGSSSTYREKIETFTAEYKTFTTFTMVTTTVVNDVIKIYVDGDASFDIDLANYELAVTRID